MRITQTKLPINTEHSKSVKVRKDDHHFYDNTTRNFLFLNSFKGSATAVCETSRVSAINKRGAAGARTLKTACIARITIVRISIATGTREHPVAAYRWKTVRRRERVLAPPPKPKHKRSPHATKNSTTAEVDLANVTVTQAKYHSVTAAQH